MNKILLSFLFVAVLFTTGVRTVQAVTVSDLKAQVVALISLVHQLPSNTIEQLHFKVKLLTQALQLQIQVNALVQPTPTQTVFLPSATTDTSYDMGVLVIKYFPVTADRHIDIKVTGDIGEPYDLIKKRTDDVTEQLRLSLEKSTSYLGYKNTEAKPALRYTIVNTIEHQEAVPIKPREGRPTYADTNTVLLRENICDYVKNRNVKEVWLWAYQGPSKPGTDNAYLDIAESKMSGPNGDISNSYRYNDLPQCGKTYRLYTFNYGRFTSEALESWGHQIETEMDAVDRELYRDKFVGPAHPQATNEIGRCGSVHNPPNARNEYDRDNPTPQRSDCLDWNPDSMGKLTDIGCAQWGCGEKDPVKDNASLNYQIWMFQNIPGRGNTKTYQGKQLRNWWDVHGNFDEVMKNNRKLTL